MMQVSKWLRDFSGQIVAGIPDDAKWQPPAVYEYVSADDGERYTQFTLSDVNDHYFIVVDGIPGSQSKEFNPDFWKATTEGTAAVREILTKMEVIGAVWTASENVTATRWRDTDYD